MFGCVSFAQIDASGGQMPRRQFQIIPEFADGQTRRLGDPEFTLEPNAVGSITPNGGLFMANGIIGGRATVRVEM